jgi:hypothetical protein
MSKTFFGWDGKYEIYNDSCIIQQKFNNYKELINKYKIYNNADSIPNQVDKISIRKIIDFEFTEHLRQNLISPQQFV